MKNRHLCRGGGPAPDLGQRPDKTAGEEISPCGGDEMAGRQLTQDLVNEPATFRRSLDGVTAGDPAARGARHDGTITPARRRSVTNITFPGLVLGMMRAWPLRQVSTATTW